jgi:ferredoxin
MKKQNPFIPSITDNEMSKIINLKTGKSEELKDGEKIREVIERLGVPFGCEDGICGTCMIDIIEGEDNLSELTEQEKDLMRDKKHRLACQCKIKKGDIKFEIN